VIVAARNVWSLYRVRKSDDRYDRKIAQVIDQSRSTSYVSLHSLEMAASTADL
jgi:hypothetical protein